MPNLMLGVCAYLLALPFLPLQAAAVALMALALAFVVSPPPAGPDPGWNFLLPLIPFAASELLAVARAPDPVVASLVLSFMLPGLVIFVITMRNPNWRLAHWLLAWTVFSAVLSITVLAGWAAMHLGHATQAMMGTPEGPLIYAHSQLLLVPNDICVTAVLMACPMALLADRTQPANIRALGLATIILSAIAIAVLRSRTAIVVSVVELAVASLLWRRLLLWLLPAGVLLLLLDHLLGLQLTDKLMFSSEAGGHGVSGRLGLWSAAWTMFTTAPWFGHGAQAYGLQHGDLLPPWSPRFPERRAMWAHSLYLETLADQGLTGAAALMLIFYWPMRNLCVLLVHGLRKGYIKRESGFALAGIAGFLTASGLELSFIRRWVPLVMFGLVGVALRAASQPTATLDGAVEKK